MVEKSIPESIEIAYFAVRETSDGAGFIGAILVTNERGIPIEFRCTHPVRPSATQKALYGDNLEPFIYFELCGKPLMSSISSRPVACLVESRRTLGLREFVSIPVLHVEALSEMLTPDDDTMEPTAGTSGRRTVRLDSMSDDFDPVVVHAFQGFETDNDAVNASLEQVFKHVDLIEPFERIDLALQVLSARDERFK